MTAQHQTLDRIKTNLQDKVLCLLVNVPVLKQHVQVIAKRIGGAFWKHTEDMGKSDTRPFDGIL